MATLYSTRIRQTPEPSGVIYGVRPAGRKYKVEPSLISKWIKNGEVALVGGPTTPGAPLAIDDSSLRKRLQFYTPDKDNKSRRRRSRTIPEMQAEARAEARSNGVNGHSNNGVFSPGTVRPASLARPQSGEVVLLNTREWIDRFYVEQVRSFGGDIRPKTKESYDWTFDRFMPRFATVPMERKVVLDYIHGLTNLHKGGPLSNAGKALALRVLTTFYGWLKREYSYEVPNLTHPNLSRIRPNAVAIWPDEIRAVLSMARNHSQYTVVLLLAQTAARIGELCTIRPECLHDHWVDVWGKPTRSNRTGYRKLPIPDEAYDHLLRELRTYKQLVWVDQFGVAVPLAGPLEPTDGGRAINMLNPDTFMVRPRDTAIKALQSKLRTLMRHAGVYEEGKLAHAFRRAYQAEFVKNGGAREWYRLIMGHFQVSNMDDLYTHARIEDIVEQARKYAPRRFLKEPADQVEMALGVDLLDDDEEGEDE